MKYICLRDDDTSFFTTPEQLRYCYGEYWSKLPITLATIPFIHGSSNKINEFGYEVPNAIKVKLMREWQRNATRMEIEKFHTFNPIGNNTALVDMLKRLISEGKIEIAQHGVFHRYTEIGAEMLSNQMSFQWIRDGKEYLEKVFEKKIKTFIPPSNTIDRKMVGYLRKLNMNLFSSGSIAHSSKMEMVWSYLLDPFSIKDKLLSYVGISEGPMFRRCNYYYFSSFTYDAFKDQSFIYDNIMRSLEKTGFAGLGTHYEVLLNNKEYRNMYHNLLSKLLMIEGVEFVTASKYYDLIVSKYYGQSR